MFMTFKIIYRNFVRMGKIKEAIRGGEIQMQETEISQRIRELCNLRGWSIYRLAKECGITYSTLCTMLNSANYPSIPTLSKICNGLGISLTDFFDPQKPSTFLDPQALSHLQMWTQLTEENRAALEKYVCFLLQTQNEKK